MTDRIVFKCGECGCEQLEAVVENVTLASLVVDLGLFESDGADPSLCYNTEDSESAPDSEGTLRCLRCANCGRHAAEKHTYDLALMAQEAKQRGDNVCIY